MPQFHVLAKKNPTDLFEEVVEANSREEILQYIAKLGYVPLRIVLQSAENQSTSPPKLNQAVPAPVMESFMRQFASLTRSQIPILQTLRVLEEQSANKTLKAILAQMKNSIQSEGKSLSEAMKMFPNAFPVDQVNLIYAGETGGVLQEILDQLANKLEREQNLKSKLQGAVVYPLFVGGVGIMTVIFLILFVLPKILNTLKGLGGALPLPTKILIGITQAAGNIWFWVFAAVGGVMLAMVIAGVMKNNRPAFDGLFLKIPVVGSLIQSLELGRFCSSFGLLLNHGVLVLQALDASIPVVGNQYIKAQLYKIPAVVREGRTLTDGFKSISMSTPYMLQSVSVGETGGRMSEVLKEVSDYYEKEAEKKMQIFSTLLEPCMILGVGLLVGFIVMAVMMPIFEVSVAVR